ncbi:ATP-binding protein [Roseococcus sp. DSY-14]|uniref:ATP-binding protein n=1 Tax=Roseococcus sp. DSY-14 TaxID=3369650 RepID=UPI00387B308C
MASDLLRRFLPPGRTPGLRALRALALLALLVPAMVLAGYAALTWEQQERLAEERLDRAADLLLEHATRVFDTYELLASYADELVRDLSPAGIRADEAEIHARLVRFKEALPQVQDVWLVDGQGRGLAAANVFPIPPNLDLSDRNYWRALRDGVPEPYLSDVLQGRAQSSAVFFQYARRLSPGPDGAFRGVVAVSVQPDYFRDYFARVRAFGLSSAALIRPDGYILARHPAIAPGQARLVPNAGFPQAMARNPEGGTYLGVSAQGGGPVSLAYRRLSGHPLYVVVGMSRETVRAAWLRGLVLPLAIGLPAALALFALARVALGQAGREAEALAALREETARAEEAEAARRRLDARYRAWFAHASEGLFVIAVEEPQRFVIEALSPANEAISGLDARKVEGKELSEAVPAETAAVLRARFAACAAARAPITYEDELEVPAGRRRFESSLAPILDEAGRVTHLVGASRDVTERRALEERLGQAQRMEALGQMSAGVAHDFNNILQVVVGNLDMLRRAPEARRERLIGAALQAAEQGSRITGQLLAFSRRQPLRPEPTELNALLAEVEGMLLRSLRADIRLVLAPSPVPAWVELDAAQMQTALINLAVNARDAMPRGGTLAVRLRVEGEEVALEVADTGEGMPPEVLARLGEPFFTTKRESGRGTGLGLAQVFGFVQQSGGRVEAESAPGAGTRLVLRFPRAAAGTPAAPAEPPMPAGPSAAGPLRLLLVEDTPEVAAATAGLLEARGHAVTLADGAEAALAALQGEARFDLVLSDLVMPGEMDGLALARAIRRVWPGLPVLLVSGYSDAAGEAAREGFPLLLKPVPAETLVAEITRLAA